MPTFRQKKFVKSGNSDMATLPKDWANWVKKETQEEEPEIEIYVDGLVLIKAKNIPIDDHVKAGVNKILDSILEKQKKESDEK